MIFTIALILLHCWLSIVLHCLKVVGLHMYKALQLYVTMSPRLQSPLLNQHNINLVSGWL